MQRFTTVLKSSNNPLNESAAIPVIATRSNIYIRNQPSIKSSNECSSSPLTTNSDSSSDTNNDTNETVTLTNADTLNASTRYNRPARRFFNGKSKSAAVSRSTSTSRIMAAERIYLDENSSDEENHLSTSETDDLNSDEDNKLVYKTCMESPLSNTGLYLKKSMSRPECALKNYQFNSIESSKPESSRRFVKNRRNRLRTSQSLSHCKNEPSSQSNEEDNDEDLLNEDDEEEIGQENLYYRQLDGQMKTGRLSRFKIIKSKSNSALQTVQNDINRKYDRIGNSDIKQLKGNQKDDQITSQLQLNELAERLKFIEQKLMENELNAEKKTSNQVQKIASTSYQPKHHLYNRSCCNASIKPIHNQDDLCLDKGLFPKRIYPSISFGDCSEINIQPKNSKINSDKFNNKRFFSSTKSAVKNSRSIPSLFIPNKEKREEKSSVEKLGGSIMKSSSKIWKTPLNILSNINQMVDDKLRGGRWHSSKSVKSSSSSNSIRSNSICSASNLPKDINQSANNRHIIGNRKDLETKSLNNRFVHNLSNLSSRKNSQNNQSNGSSQNDIAKSNEYQSQNSSQFSSTKNLDITMPFGSMSKQPLQKARAFSTPNEEIFNLLSLPFMEEEPTVGKPDSELDKFDYKVKQSKSYKEIGSQALKEIEEFEKLLSNKFTKNQLK